MAVPPAASPRRVPGTSVTAVGYIAGVRQRHDQCVNGVVAVICAGLFARVGQDVVQAPVVPQPRCDPACEGGDADLAGLA